MNTLAILAIRIVLGAVFGVVLMRIFHPEAPFVYVVLLGAVMVGAAYFFDYMRKRRAGR
jgi:hypothetical protein